MVKRFVTLAELGEMLPSEFYYPEYDENCHMIYSKNSNNEHIIYYVYAEEGGEVYNIVANTEANARAQMLIYLIENGLLKND